MKAIYLKELRGYFKSPLGYVFVGVVLALFGIFYSIYTLYTGYANYGSSVLSSTFTPLMFIIPILTMRIFAEESKNKTDQMLMTAPISNWAIVLGKFFAAATVIVGTLLLTGLQPLTTKLLYNGVIGYATTWGGYLGIFLLSMMLLSIGMFISSMTENQLVSVIVTLGVALFFNLTSGIGAALPADTGFSAIVVAILVAIVVFLLYRAIHDLIICGIVGVVGLVAIVTVYLIVPTAFEGLIGTMLEWISPMARMSELFSGTFDFSQIIYFVAVSVFFLFLTNQVLEKKRWN